MAEVAGAGARLRLGVLVLLIVAGVLLLRLTPAGELLSREGIFSVISYLRSSSWAPVLFVAIYAAAVALEAAQARDPDRVFDSGEIVYNSCNTCHSVYWVGDEERGRAVR